jgi:short-subunit dehydrogenase
MLVEQTTGIMNSNSPYALISGGSKGLGYSIARALAKRNYNLLLVARHKESLEEAKTQIESRYPVQVDMLVLDMAEKESVDKIARWCIEKNIRLKMLCNVAGLGGAKDYLSLPVDDLRYMVRVNIEAQMALCLALIPLLEKNTPSYIMNMSSIAAFAPIPIKNLYSATKSAILFFSYSLRYQLKNKNISVSCVCPGPVFTSQEIINDTIEKMGWLGKLIEVDPARVGEIAVRRTLNGRMVIVPGTLAKIISVVLRLLPRRVVVYIYHRLGKKSIEY